MTRIETFQPFHHLLKEHRAGKKKSNGVPAKVKEIADAVKRDNPGISDEKKMRIAWSQYNKMNEARDRLDGYTLAMELIRSHQGKIGGQISNAGKMISWDREGRDVEFQLGEKSDRWFGIQMFGKGGNRTYRIITGKHGKSATKTLGTLKSFDVSKAYKMISRLVESLEESALPLKESFINEATITVDDIEDNDSGAMQNGYRFSKIGGTSYAWQYVAKRGNKWVRVLKRNNAQAIAYSKSGQKKPTILPLKESVDWNDEGPRAEYGQEIMEFFRKFPHATIEDVEQYGHSLGLEKDEMLHQVCQCFGEIVLSMVNIVGVPGPETQNKQVRPGANLFAENIDMGPYGKLLKD